jgi:hypothetical protein
MASFAKNLATAPSWNNIIPDPVNLRNDYRMEMAAARSPPEFEPQQGYSSVYAQIQIDGRIGIQQFMASGAVLPNKAGYTRTLDR